MSAGDIPAWAAAAGFEAGAVLPVLHHGESIGLAYALGKSWQTPRKEAMKTAARFLELAATHYAVAAPYAGAAVYPTEPEPRARTTAPARQSSPGPVRTAERISSWPARQAQTGSAPARTTPSAPVSAPQPTRPAVPTARTPVERPTPAPASSSRWLPKAVISAGEATQDAPAPARMAPEPSAPPKSPPPMARPAQPPPPAAPQATAPQPAPVVLPVGQAAAAAQAAQAATEEAAQSTPTYDMSGQRRRLDLPGIALDPRTERCVVDGNALSLSKTEFDLLYALAVRNGEITAGSDLISAVWGDSTTAPNNALDVTIHRLRRKLSRVPGGSDLVKTVRGKGYTLTLTR